MAEERTAQGPASAGELDAQVRQRLRVAVEHRFDVRRAEREPGRDRQPRAQRARERRGLAAEVRLVERVDERRGLHRPRLHELDHARVAVDPHPRAVGEHRRRLARADDGRDAVLARDDRRVRELAAAIGDDGAEQRQDHVEGRARVARDEHVALLQPVEILRAVDDSRRALVDARMHRQAGDAPGRRLLRRAR